MRQALEVEAKAATSLNRTQKLVYPAIGLGCVIALLFIGSMLLHRDATIKIGSKAFTESVILGEILCRLTENAGSIANHRSELGGTQFVWKALLGGEIDAYVEYTGTISEEILSGEGITDLDEMRARLKQQGIEMSAPLGFNNTYAMGMTDARATELGITRISDLASHPELKLGFSDEFIGRSDGWLGLKDTYGLPQSEPMALDHALAYRGVQAGSLDVLDLYSTDPEIISYNLRVLEDDQAYFPKYEAVVLYRQDLEESHPDVVKSILAVQDAIDGSTMTAMNKASRIDRRAESLISTDFVKEHIDASFSSGEEQSTLARAVSRFVASTGQHLLLVGVSLLLAILTGIPIGVLAYKFPSWGEWILGLVGILQTIPSLALLVFMIPLLGLGPEPAIAALFLYSLLPIVRGTHTGLAGLPPSVHESALALGLPDAARLRLIELPLASRSILSGIKTSAVINVGTATIGALIGAGGYGQPILTGIRLNDYGLIFQGAIPAAGLALLAQAFFGWAEKSLVPAGLRLENQSE